MDTVLLLSHKDICWEPHCIFSDSQIAIDFVEKMLAGEVYSPIKMKIQLAYPTWTLCQLVVDPQKPDSCEVVDICVWEYDKTDERYHRHDQT